MNKKSEQNTDSKENTENVINTEETDSEPGRDDPLNDNKTKQAVEDIEKRDSDTVLDAEDDKKFTPKQIQWYKRFFNNKKLFIPALVIFIVIIATLVPWSRYGLLGLALKQDFKVQIIDSQTLKPVSDVTLILDNKTAITNNNGQATFRVKVGYGSLLVSKKYYDNASQKILVGLKSGPLHSYKLHANGRQVPISVINGINSQPVSDVMIKAAGTKAETDQLGKATIVLPANKSTAPATLSGPGYNPSSETIKITADVISANKFKLTPTGRIYFLSNATGTINVVSANLDGTDRKVVVAGTGSEDPQNTVLLASRDWKYLALLSKRDGGENAKLFLINTSTGSMKTIDQSSSSFIPTGWDGHYFIYEADKVNTRNWQNGQAVLKSYNADTGTTIQLDQTSASGSSNDNYTGQEFGAGDTYITGNQVIYEKDWQQGFMANPSTLNGRQNQIVLINPNGSNKQVLKSFNLSSTNNEFISSVNYNPTSIYYSVSNNSGNTFYVYSNGNISPSSTLNDNTFYDDQQNYSIFLLSPSGNQTFWSELRDGKNSLFVGNVSGGDAQQIAPLSDYTPYGWYGDKYLLVEKSGSEIYAMSLDGKTVTKISDYYKPPQNVYGGNGGGGGGYGGL